MNEQQEPLLVKEWNNLVDTYGVYGTIDPDLYDRCDEAQRWFINEYKKHMARVKNKDYAGE